MAFVGLDFGTSGARMMVIDAAHHVLWEEAIAYPNTASRRDPQAWRQALFYLLDAIPNELKSQVQRIGIDGTSSTVLLCDQGGQPLVPPQMYNDSCSVDTLSRLKHQVPDQHIVLSASSSLAKLLNWQDSPEFAQATFLLHQADWLAAQLHGQWGFSDYHNSLKLGFDPALLSYPDWFEAILTRSQMALLPHPLEPGVVIGTILPAVARQLRLPETTQICAGTTDSIAAFLASEAKVPGDAVTSLGSTIALKLLSEYRVDALPYGVYSHWFGSHWLVGGASNAGCAVLAQFFTPAELERYSLQIDWTRQGLPDYIPLLRPGERFPVNDPTLQPCLEPRPTDSIDFLQAILQSLTQIEVAGYRKLQALGATALQRVFTAGGGAKNHPWMLWRARQLGVPVMRSRQPEAAFGVAKLVSGAFKF